MNKIALILVVLLIVNSGYSQENNFNEQSKTKGTIIMNSAVNNDQLELERQRLIYLNSLYIQSYIRSDIETYDKLLWAEEFTQTNPDGKVLTRKEVMENFGRPRFDKIVYLYVKDVNVEFLSNDKAVVSAINPDCFEIDGKLIKSVSRYEDTYVKQNGKWKCISAVITNIE